MFLTKGSSIVETLVVASKNNSSNSLNIEENVGKNTLEKQNDFLSTNLTGNFSNENLLQKRYGVLHSDQLDNKNVDFFLKSNNDVGGLLEKFNIEGDEKRKYERFFHNMLKYGGEVIVPIRKLDSPNSLQNPMTFEEFLNYYAEYVSKIEVGECKYLKLVHSYCLSIAESSKKNNFIILFFKHRFLN